MTSNVQTVDSQSHKKRKNVQTAEAPKLGNELGKATDLTKLTDLGRQFGVDPATVLTMLDQRIDQRVTQLLEAERPKIIEGLKKALTELAGQPSNPSPVQTNPIQSGPVQNQTGGITPQGAQILQSLLQTLSSSSGGGGVDLTRLYTLAEQMAAIRNAMTPPQTVDVKDLHNIFVDGQKTMLNMIATLTRRGARGIFTEETE
jgi:hypothetical protein